MADPRDDAPIEDPEDATVTDPADEDRPTEGTDPGGEPLPPPVSPPPDEPGASPDGTAPPDEPGAPPEETVPPDGTAPPEENVPPDVTMPPAGTRSPGATPVVAAPVLGAPGGTAAPATGRHYRAQHRLVRRWPRRILILANLLVFVIIAGAATVVGYASYELNAIPRVKVRGLAATKAEPKVKGTPRRSPPFTLLIVGSDTRTLKGSVGLAIGNAATNGENLGDSIILARVDPADHRLALLSIPRDLFVPIPGLGTAKINSAFSATDPSRLVQVITHDLGIPINHFADVNFYTFEQIANAIGGVEQYFPTPAFDIESGLQVPKAGCVDLQGAQALAFVRSRNYWYVLDGSPQLQASPESDLGRIQRQQAFVKNAIRKVERRGDLTNPFTLARLIGSVTKNVKLDTTFSDSQLISLAEDFSHVDANAIPNLTYPVVNSGNGLDRVPTADAATVAQFENLGPSTAQPPSIATAPPTSKPPATTTPTVAPATVAVEVENGSGTAGQAGQASTDLHAAGFKVSGLADAPNYSYPANVVEYGPGGLAAATTLRAALAGGATLQPEASLGSSDLVLITGRSWAGTVSGTGRPAATTTTVPATTTTLPPYGNAYSSGVQIEPSSSSYYRGAYIPPGRVAGQRIETCGA